ncbi:MAG: transaldolase [Fibrobacterota bacterium]
MTEIARTRTLHDLGQSIWLDTITRELLDSGTLQRYVDQYAVTGLTTNPTIFDQALESGSAYDNEIRNRSVAGRFGEDLFFDLAISDLVRAADIFRSIHDQTNFVDGWVSLEVPPTLSDDADSTLRIATELFSRIKRPNVLIKIPATPEGIVAIEHATFAGVPVNATLIFSREQYLSVADAWLRGVERRIVAGLDPDIRSVASVFVSRWDASVADSIMTEKSNRLGIAMANRIYDASRTLHATPRWQRAMNAGARPQRLLWASTGTKDSRAPDTLYPSALVAPFTVVTLPEKTLLAFADHGEFGSLLGEDLKEAERTIASHSEAGVDIDAMAAKLQTEGVASFVASWNKVLERIRIKTEAVALR